MTPLCRVCQAKTDAYLCRKHAGEIRTALGDAKSLMHELSNVATGQTRVYRASGRRSVDPDASLWDAEQAELDAMLRSREGRVTLPSTAAVVNLDARELLWEAGNTLSTWARDLADQLRVDTIPEDWLTWLTEHADRFRFHQAADQAHDEITYLHRRMTAAVDRSPSPLFAGPCHATITEPVATELGGTVYVEMITHRCERDLYAWPGADAIRCDGTRAVKTTEDGYLVPDHDDEGCGTEHTFADRQAWLLASVEDALLPLATWQQALPKMFPDLKWPPRQTWWRWAEVGGKHQRLFSPHRDLQGVDLYAGRHVMEVVRDAQHLLERHGGTRRRSA